MNLVPRTTCAIFIVGLFLLLSRSLLSQSYLFGKGPVNWDVRKNFTLPPEAQQYASSDLLIISDFAAFHFYSNHNERLVRNIKYKINTQKGLEDIKHYEMPESFDYGYDNRLWQQSRRARIKIPFIRDYRIKVFAARKYSHDRWSNVTVKDRYDQVRWIKSDGEFSNEDALTFHLGTLSIGDVLEIYYEVEFNAQYSNNLFYFRGPYPKLTCEYDFVYRLGNSLKDVSYFLPVNIDSAAIRSSSVGYDEYRLVTDRIILNNLKAANYPLNSREGLYAPHVYADFSYYRTTVNFANDYYSFTRPRKIKDYNWLISSDTSVAANNKIYHKQFGSVKKFASTLPPAGNEIQNLTFLNALCDTFNAFRYITANQLFYNESAIYDLYSGEHVLKRRLPAHSMWELYLNILKDNNVFFYHVNVQDKRFGVHTSGRRVHYGYEHSLMALPVADGFVYFMPRYGGVKYFRDELPFYHEGVLAIFTPMNFQPETKNKAAKLFMTRNLPAATFKNNLRLENAAVKVVTDSMLAYVTTRQSLSGQFSTILRHLYLNECIDSTISPHYFKRCADKPGTTSFKITLSSKNIEFPYKHNFNCTQKINLGKDTTKLSLKNWFSFTLSKAVIPERPNFDYYFDFDQSDSYNFQLDFNRAVELKNSEAFSRNIDNDYFTLKSGIVKNGATSYLVTVLLIIKQTSIPVNKTDLLMELVDQLDQLNRFVLDIKRG